jgi:hypothetical protein
VSDIKKNLAVRLIEACEASVMNVSREDEELVRGALDLAKAHYGTAGAGK